MDKRLMVANSLKAISIGCFIMAARAYAESRYYQGRIDKSDEIMTPLNKIIVDLQEKLEKEQKEKEEEA